MNGKKPSPDGALPTRIIDAWGFIEGYVAPDWIIDGVLQRGRLYACTSLTAHGKTAVWLYNACMIASGLPIGPHRTQKADVLILQGENPDDLRGRLIAMSQDPEIDTFPFILPGHFPIGPEHILRIRGELLEVGIKELGLVILDTAASFFPFEEENSNVQNGEYARERLRPLTQLPGGPAVVALCHPVKGAAKDNLAPRGGGAFLNELDGNFTLWSEVLGQTTTLHWQDKIRGPDFTPLNYRLKSTPLERYTDNFGNPPFSVTASPMTEDAVASQTASNLINQNHVLSTLRDNPSFSMGDVARALGWIDPVGQPQKYKVDRLIKTLAKDKLVYQPRTGGRWVLTQKGKELNLGARGNGHA